MYPNCTYAFHTLIVSCYAFVRQRNTYLVTALAACLLCSSMTYAQCIPPSMTFRNPTFISGTKLKVGALYRFSNVTTGVDATIQIMGLHNGTTLHDMDNTTQGYPDAWQPYVTAGKNDTSYLDWKITFKKAGTNVDTVLPCLAITAIDIDGDNSRLKEYIKASTPGAYAVDPNTLLDVSFDGVNSVAIGPVSVVNSIDTAEKKYMFQMNFTGVSTIYYRNGAISTKNTTDTRHTCIYFKSFFSSGLITLPVRLISFTAKTAGEGALLDWVIADEQEVADFTIQKSADGKQWTTLGKVTAQPGLRNYTYSDKSGGGRTFYRLQQTALNGSVSYSRIIGINRPGGTFHVQMPSLVTKNIPVQLETAEKGTYHFNIYNSVGAHIANRSVLAQAGINFTQLELPAAMKPGMYMIAVRNARGAIVGRTRVIVQ